MIDDHINDHINNLIIDQLDYIPSVNDQMSDHINGYWSLHLIITI